MLKIWFPGTNDTEDYGLGGTQWINDNVVITDNGKLGKCLSFNGSNSRLSTTNFELSNNWSFACWAKDDLSVTNWRLLIMLNTTGSDADTQMSLWLHTGEKRFEVCANGKYVSTVKYVPGQWNHFAATYDGSQILVYLNGAKVYTLSDTNEQLVRHNLTIGARGTNSNGGHEGATSYFFGLVNDLRIWDNQVISPRGIKELSKGLVLHYPLAMPGQENLIVNSSGYGGINGWNVSKANSLSVVDDSGNKCLKITSVSGDTNRININQSLNSKIDINNLTTYTISFYYKAELTNNTSGVGAFIRIANSSSLYNDRLGSTSTLTLDNNWHFASITGDLSSFNGTGVTSVTLFLFAYKAAVYYSRIKFELGSIATPWIPNTADTAYSDLGFNDGIEYDVSGYGNNGTKVGTITYDSDTPRYNTSTILNGTYISLASLTNSTISQFSICGWANLLTGYTANYGCHLINFNKTYCRICVSKDGAALKILLTDGTTNYTLASVMTASSLSANVWNHYAVTFDNGSIKIYINGQLDRSAQATITAISPSTTWTIGNHGTTEFPKAKVSDVRFYSTPLSADDILELYNTPETLSHNGVLLTQGEYVES